MTDIVESELYVIASGRISGTRDESFHKLTSEGKTGYRCNRKPSKTERDQMLSDIERHKASLIAELRDLDKAETLLRAMPESELHVMPEGWENYVSTGRTDR